jgi:hypothetical protein
VRERAIVFFTLFAAYAWFFGGSGFNQNATFDLTRALVERGQLHIDPYAGNTADVSFHDGHVYPNKAPGLAFVAAIPYAIIHAVNGPPKNALELNLYLYLCTVVVCGISGALIGVLLYDVRGPATALLAGLGTPLFAYSTMLFAHVPSALLVLLAFQQRAKRPAAAGAAIGAATCINYLCAPLVLLFIPRKAVLGYLAGGLPFAIALGAYHYAAFGSPFRTSIATMNPAFVEQGAALGIFHLPRLDALWGITFSPYRGLFYLAPVVLLALSGLRDRLIWIAFALMLLFNASFNGWHGGYAVGPRYLIAVIPLVMLGLPHHRKLLLAFGTISLFFNFAVTAVDPQPPDSLRDPIGKYAIPSLLTGRAAPDEKVPWLRDFYTGHTSTNRVAADELLPFRKHAPGSPESEWASFNLGELLFGPGSFASIVPIVVLVSLAWTLGLRRAPRTTPETPAAQSRSA